jgi:magnesium chelatase family protein
LLDRIDIHVDVPAVKFQDLSGATPPPAEGSAEIRQRVMAARSRQHHRLAGAGVYANALMSSRQLRQFCRLDTECEEMLERAMLLQGLSARAYNRILKVSRTIADLDNKDSIQSDHLSEAISYRSLDRTYWV